MKKYYCTKCKKNHHRGKIYKDHLKFKEDKKTIKITNDEKITVDFNSLRPIAKRQFNRLLKKMEKTGNQEIYRNEIIKLINNEKRK
ncbi:MAG: hypothetical protein ACFFD2_21385 [Promethearchaeota archaeon]